MLSLPAEIGPCGDLGPRAMITYCPTPVLGTWVPQVFNSCVHNEVDALLKRALGPVPKADSYASFRSCMRRVGRFCRAYSGEEWDLTRVVESYSGPMRERYARAVASFGDAPFSERDARLECFVKGEKMRVRADVPLKPRLIFPRSPRYNVLLARFLKPFEHWLWPRLALASRGVARSRNVSKGLNHVGRAALIVKKMAQFDSPVVFEVDARSFEAHVSLEQLQAEQGVYLSAFHRNPAACSSLQSLLSYQFHNKGRTPNGVRFSRRGGRASGDFNTGMGNSLIMLGLVMSVMRSYRVRYDCLVDGDNALLFVERVDARHVTSTFADKALKLVGHEVQLESPVDFLEGVEYGQSRPVFDGERHVMVRNWLKVLSHATSSYTRMQHPEDVAVFLKGVALCELSLARGLPVLQEFFYRLWAACAASTARLPRPGGFREYEHLGVRVDRVLSRPPAVRPVTSASRVSFERAFGVEVELQRLLEGRFSFRFVRIPPTVPGVLPSESWLLEWD